MTNEEKTYRIIVSGGGRGGHIYPAIAVANTLSQKLTRCEILFVGAKGKMEMQKVPEAGYKIIGLNIAGLQRKLTAKNLLFPFKTLGSVLKAFSILKSFKPDAVVGFGGYASAPMLFAASRKGLSTVIQEQNSYAGITNKMLGSRVNKICVSYEGMDRFFPGEKIVVTGNPVRKSIADISGKKHKGCVYFGLDPQKPIILVLGGSLGARTINESVIAHLDKVREAGVQLLWQCGKMYFDEMLERTADKLGNGIILMEFIADMDLAYAVGDIVVSRAGALSISELCLAGKPVIFVPSPNVAEDHQTKNAMALVEKNAAEIIADREAKERLIPEALKLIDNENRRKELTDNISKLAKPDAVDDIVEEILRLISK
ncbi:MAG: undecaprenyldiphospho-muramoylpentapeptide beta-N-acetylglucosaminyltransferase [Cyclobacteriaceae bacterium]